MPRFILIYLSAFFSRSPCSLFFQASPIFMASGCKTCTDVANHSFRHFLDRYLLCIYSNSTRAGQQFWLFILSFLNSLQSSGVFRSRVQKSRNHASWWAVTTFSHAISALHTRALSTFFDLFLAKNLIDYHRLKHRVECFSH